MVVGEVPEPLGSCKDQIEKSIVPFWVPAAMIDHPSPGITDEKTATALNQQGFCPGHRHDNHASIAVTASSPKICDFL
jgi:hypothetical protein